MNFYCSFNEMIFRVSISQVISLFQFYSSNRKKGKFAKVSVVRATVHGSPNHGLEKERKKKKETFPRRLSQENTNKERLTKASDASRSGEGNRPSLQSQSVASIPSKREVSKETSNQMTMKPLMYTSVI